MFGVILNFFFIVRNFASSLLEIKVIKSCVSYLHSSLALQGSEPLNPELF